jgi:periplasmic copper chaperone A
LPAPQTTPQRTVQMHQESIKRQRRLALQALWAASLGWALPQARACEFYTGLLRVTHPWTRATASDATTAVLCMRLDEVTTADRLIGASTPVATGAEMGGVEPGRSVDIPVPVDQITELTEDGPHIRLTGLKHALQVGRDYPLTLEFERSGLVLARMSVDFTTTRFN